MAKVLGKVSSSIARSRGSKNVIKAWSFPSLGSSPFGFTSLSESFSSDDIRPLLACNPTSPRPVGRSPALANSLRGIQTRVSQLAFIGPIAMGWITCPSPIIVPLNMSSRV